MTRGQITGAVLARLGISAAEVADLAQAEIQLDQEYLRLVSEEHLNTAAADLILSVGEPLADLPPDLVGIDTISIGRRRLARLNRQRLLDLEAGGYSEAEADQGPRYYAFWSPGRIRVWPAPAADSQSGTRVVYDARPAVLADDLDEPEAVPTEYHDLLIDLVVYELARTREEAYDLAQAALAAALDKRARLSRHVAQRAGIGDYRIRQAVYSTGRAG